MKEMWRKNIEYCMCDIHAWPSVMIKKDAKVVTVISRTADTAATSSLRTQDVLGVSVDKSFSTHD